MQAMTQPLASFMDVVLKARDHWDDVTKHEAFAANKTPEAYLRYVEKRERISTQRLERERILETFEVPLKPETRRRLIEDKHDRSDPVRLIQKWLTTTGDPFLIISGPLGIGKSSAAAVGAFCEQGGEYLFASDLMTRLTVSFSEKEKAKVKDKVLTRRFVTVDELGEENPGAYYKSLFLKFINMRPALGRTLFLTNLLEGQIHDLYGIKIYDKIKEQGVFADLADSPRLRTYADFR